MSIIQAYGRPLPALTRARIRDVDRYAIEELGIPGIVLMENAGRNAAGLIAAWVRRKTDTAGGDRRVAVICGRGNNGGDGLVIARHLHQWGLPVSVDLAGDPDGLSPDALTNYRIVERMGLTVRRVDGGPPLASAARRWGRCGVLVDALLGTGFRGSVRSPASEVIERLNRVKGPLKVAIDVPSGLDADEGQAEGPAVEADRTITMVATKVGFTRREARRYVGRVHVVDIGVSAEMILRRLRLGKG